MRFTLIGLACAVTSATPAAALQAVTITSAGIYNPGTVDATVGGNSKSEYAVPLTFTAASSKGGTIDFLGFCVDLSHQIYVGIGSQLAKTLHYHAAPLTGDGSGNALSGGQVREITALAHLGFTIAVGADVDKDAQVAAIQQAIWTVEYPTAIFTATGPYASVQDGYAATFISEAPHLTGFARFIASDDGVSQGQITNIGGVPEPASWAMMLIGFSIVGGFSRRRRGLTIVAA